MSPLLLVLILVIILSAKMLAGLYLGADYACPLCGTTREDQHADECPWKR
jgi:hypothetical protein